MRMCGRVTINLFALLAMMIALVSRAEERGAPVAAKPAAAQDNIAVYFSPHGGCTEAIVEQLNAATKSIHIQAYSFTSAPIGRAILKARERGVAVTAVLDKSHRTEKYSAATLLSNGGAAVLIDDKHAIAHNKVILIDGKVIITGSFNFSKAAEESNAENLLIIRDKAELYEAYEKNFQAHREHAQKYEPRAGTDGQPENRQPPAAARPPAAPPAAGEVTVYVTRTGKKYHREGCGSLASSSTPVTLSQARSNGMGPCSRCNPPE